MDFLDKTGRAIQPGDTLKLYHFTGPRRKKFYMYKYVLDFIELGKDERIGLRILHLSYPLNPDSSYFTVICDDKIHDDFEIVQGNSDGYPIEERKKKILKNIRKSE
ncbi:hypothetical protein [Leptospira interrogans]|uniref:hypothetical protein n=1 Tax=Leptospira interrogans TaxID=173 RepID=UPI00046C4F96|nr:hypothetical protein [Leptospira interrogans]